MKEEKHIYSTSRIKRLEDMFEALKKEAKTYFQFERKTKISKPVSLEKPAVPPPPKPRAAISEAPVIITTTPPSSLKAAISKKIDVQKITEKPKKKSAKKKLTLSKELEEKILALGLLLAILFFIVLGILLSYKR